MPASSAPPGKHWIRRGGAALHGILQSWWKRRISFLLSLAITASALSIYYFVFLQETKTPIAEFAQRLELNTLDTRFRYRPRRYDHPDPRIVIVDIDQHSQEVLGKWPFSRAQFAKLLDALHDDGAKVAAFDITFSKPDQSAAPIRALWTELEAREKSGEQIDPQFAEELQKLLARYNADKQFAAAIHRFGPVVLGNFFLYTDADLRGMGDATLDTYANQIAFFAFPQVIGVREGFQKQDRVHLIEEFAGGVLLPKGAEANIDELTGALGGESWTGFFNAPPDADGVVRRATTILPYGRSANLEEWDLYGSLDLMTVRAYLGAKDEQTVLRYGRTGIVDIQLGPRMFLYPDERGQLQINYQGPVGSYAHYSMADVVEQKFSPGTFRDKIVLVGATATGIGDMKTTPYGGTDYPGVEIHGNVIDNMLNHGFLKSGPKQALTDVLLILLFGIAVGIWMALVTPRWMWFGLGLLAPFAALNDWAFLHGWWLNFIVPAVTLTSNVLLVALFRALTEEKEKRRVRSAFGQYLSPEVIRRLLENPDLVQPRKTEITVMFSDIRGFTGISEKLDAQELALFLNEYLSDMTRLVFAHGGTLDKYIGDAVMAFWGAPFEEPGHAAKACRSALEMMKRVRELQQKWRGQGKPPMDIGIGLNTGLASVGNMGSALRYGYTALGDAVNLSSRIEGLNKEYGTHILVNETTYAGAREAGFVFRELDLIQVKGKLEPIVLYELVGHLEDGPEANGSAPLELFARALSLYKNRQWGEARRAFQAVLEQSPADGPAQMYVKRCEEFLREAPPASWNGVYVMTHK